jgi:hypothetical protein
VGRRQRARPLASAAENACAAAANPLSDAANASDKRRIGPFGDAREPQREYWLDKVFIASKLSGSGHYDITPRTFIVDLIGFIYYIVLWLTIFKNDQIAILN